MTNDYIINIEQKDSICETCKKKSSCHFINLSNREIYSKCINFMSKYHYHYGKGKETIRKRYIVFLKLIKKEKCAICNYDRCRDALDIHHLDETKKTQTMGMMKFAIGKKKLLEFLEERKTGLVVCRNCHAEIHNNQISEELIKEKIEQSKIDYNEFLDKYYYEYERNYLKSSLYKTKISNPRNFYLHYYDFLKEKNIITEEDEKYYEFFLNNKKEDIK